MECSSRAIDERACIFNSGKIQLLRRSLILEDDPMKALTSDTSRSSFFKTIGLRTSGFNFSQLGHNSCCGVCHPIALFANQLKLSLLCSDDILECQNINKNKTPLSITETPILREYIKTFTEKWKC